MEILVFGAPWCNKCKALEAWLDRVDVAFTKLDVDASPMLVTNYGIKSLPTTIVVDDDGEELQRKTGTDIKSLLDDMLITYDESN